MTKKLIFFGDWQHAAAAALHAPAWYAYCDALHKDVAPAAVASLGELKKIAGAGTEAIFWAAGARATGLAAVLAQFARVLKPGGVAAIGCDAAIGPQVLGAALHCAGFGAVAASGGTQASWAVATRGRAMAQQLHGLAGQLLPGAEGRYMAAEDRLALERRFHAADFSGAAAAAALLLPRFPQDGKLWDLYGVAALQAGQDGASLQALRHANALLPADAEVWEHLALAWRRAGQPGAARDSFERSIALDARRPSAWSNAARIALDIGDFAAAARYAEGALALDPALLAANCNLGDAMAGLKRPAEAVRCYQRALAHHPDNLAARFILGSIHRRNGQSTEAIDCLRQVLAAAPGHADAWGTLGLALIDQGLHQQAEACLRRSLALEPDQPRRHASLLYCMSHDPATAPEASFAEHLAFGARFEPPLAALRKPHRNLRDPGRRLRVGFVSGDLRAHPVAYFIESVWAALDRGALELLAYSSHPDEDEVSARLRPLVRHWRPVALLDDAELAALIEADGIDVLIDLSGHTTFNRLLAFARKPAPLQATWIGYPNTTGLQAIDYVLCDPFNAPQGWYEHLYVEKFARLPSSGSFDPPPDSPAPNRQPALARGHVTFGSFNRASKLGEEAVAAWCRVLHQVPGSRMLLGHMSDPGAARHATALFGRHGIEAGRLELRPGLTLHDYLCLHHEVDIVLDTWPYTGGTTTNFALWMGVPVVTMRGPARAHCQSAAVLGRMGLGDWVADDPAQFVRLAVAWAQRPAALGQLRESMRARWDSAPLRQPATVARGFELAVRHMWRRWCDGLPPAHFEIAGERLAQREEGLDA